MRGLGAAHLLHADPHLPSLDHDCLAVVISCCLMAHTMPTIIRSSPTGHCCENEGLCGLHSMLDIVAQGVCLKQA